MTAAEVIERTVTRAHLAESRRLAISLFARLEKLLENGYDPQMLHTELYAQFRKYREAGDRVSRDALAEVIEEIEERLVA